MRSEKSIRPSMPFTPLPAVVFFFQAEDGIRDLYVTGVQTCALPISDVASREIVWAYCGIAGADHPAHRQEIVDSLNIFFPRGNFTVDNDARIALTGAIGFGAGAVVIEIGRASCRERVWMVEAVGLGK